ncbi:MAG: O-antigen ligase family protein [Rubrobacter sp.]|nr:O-antigen ligase family protein [Rubrobacter sp.]
MNLLKLSKNPRQLVPSLTLVAIVLLASWMGYESGGYFTKDWAPVLFALAGIALVAALTGTFYGARSRWSTAALILFVGYAVWTAASVLWSSNRGDAWLGVSQTLMYLIAFGLALGLLALGASRRWVLIASVLGPAVVGAFALLSTVSDLGNLFKDNRFVGTVGYYNGEPAFLLVPFWVAVYLAGSKRTNWVARGLVLASATLAVELATLTQSRGAMVAMAVSLPIFFAFSGQRLRGLLALIPVMAALIVSFPTLNGVYLAFRNGLGPEALEDAVSLIWWTCAAAGLYGLLWALADRRWSPPADLVRASSTTVLVVLVAALIVGGVIWGDRGGGPVSWTTERWEDFRSDRSTGQEQSRYLSASGAGRYTLWQVAWRDFTANPLLGVGTQNYEATYYQLREKWIEWAKYARQPHSLPLEVLSERGVIGGVLFFGFLGVCLAAGLQQRFKYLNVEGKALVGALVAAVSYWFVHSTAEWFWQLPAITLPVFVYLAVLVTPWRRAAETETLRWPMRAGIAFGAVLVISTVAPLYIADRYLARSYASVNPRVALDFVKSAQKFNPVNPQLAQRAAQLEIRLGDWPRAKQAYDEATRLNPEHYAPYVLLARYYEQVGEPKEALSSYREALALNPLDKELKREATQLETKAEA